MNRKHRISQVLREFNLTEHPLLLPGGSTQTFRVGNAVLKRIRETSLENNHSLILIQWIADFSLRLHEDGFRVPKPLPTVDNTWITPDGWTAWTFLEGRHASRADIPECIPAIVAFHKALKPISKHPLMDDNRTPWGKADRWCWGEKPAFVEPKLRSLVDQHYALRQPVDDLEFQLIHADLSPEIILIAPGLSHAFLDLSPFWGPPEFALAIFANFSGPRRGDASVLKYFEAIPQFDQLLIRAGIRMLLVMEAVRSDVDSWLLDFISKPQLSKHCFYVKDDGGVRLTLYIVPQLSVTVSLWSKRIEVTVTYTVGFNNSGTNCTNLPSILPA